MLAFDLWIDTDMKAFTGSLLLLLLIAASRSQFDRNAFPPTEEEIQCANQGTIDQAGGVADDCPNLDLSNSSVSW